MESLKRLWRGDVPLPVAFWTWGVAGGLVVNLVTTGLTILLIVAHEPVWALVVGYAVAVPYNIVVAVGIWRAADRFDGDPRWAMWAKIVTVLGMTALSLT